MSTHISEITEIKEKNIHVNNVKEKTINPFITKLVSNSSDSNLSNLSEEEISTPIIERKVSKLDIDCDTESSYSIINEKRSLTVDEKQMLLNSLRDLTETQYYYIYELIKKDTDNFRVNPTGVYVSLNILSDEIQKKIYNYLIVIHENKKKHISKEEFIYQHNIDSVLSGLDSGYSDSIKLSNHERAIIKKNKYLQDQKEFKRNTSIKKKVKKKRGRKSSSSSSLSSKTAGTSCSDISRTSKKSIDSLEI